MARILGRGGIPRAEASRDRPKAVLRQQGQKLEGGAAGVFLAALPLVHQACGHVQVAGEHGLTGVLPQAERLDRLGRHVLDRGQAHLVESPHGALRHDAVSARPVPYLVMAALVAAIHVAPTHGADMDARNKSAHDGVVVDGEGYPQGYGMVS